MKKAEQFAEEDKKRREEAEVVNKADSLVYQAEKPSRTWVTKSVQMTKTRSTMPRTN